MPARDPFKYPYPKGLPRLESFVTALKRSNKKPLIGVTQGGSSRDAKGARVAATTADFRKPKNT